MDWIVKGLIGLAILAAVIGALTWINHAIGEHYIAPVRAELGAKLATCEQNTADAVKANQVVRATLAQTVKAFDEVTAETAAKAKSAAIRAAIAIAKAQADAKYMQPKIDKDAATASGPPTPGTFEQQCRAADTTLTDLARDAK